MPNHIKNRIEIIGTEEEVKEVVKKYSTFYEKTLNRTSDETEIICNDSEDNFIGWYNENTDDFEYASKRGEKTKGLPDGAKYQYNDAFVQMPDFNKIIKCPDSLNIESGSSGDMGYSIITGESENRFMVMQELLSRFYRLDATKRAEVLEIGLKYFKNMEEYGAKTWYDWNIKNWGTKWNSYACEKESDSIFTFETAWGGVPDLIELISKEFPAVKIIYEYSDEDTGSNCGSITFENGVGVCANIENCSNEAYDIAFKLRPKSKEYYELINGNWEYKDED